MAVIHKCWRFLPDDGVRALGGLNSLDHILSPAVSDRVAAIRQDPARREQLEALRLDAQDDEVWAMISTPNSADFGLERAGAARLMLLLTEVCSPAGGLRAPPSFVEDLLRDQGWPQERIELALLGSRLYSFFDQHVLDLREAVKQCQSWLAGGWLPAEQAAELRGEIERDWGELHARVDEAAARQGQATGLGRAWHEGQLRLGLADLHSMLSQADRRHALWIVQD